MSWWGLHWREWATGAGAAEREARVELRYDARASCDEIEGDLYPEGEQGL